MEFPSLISVFIVTSALRSSCSLGSALGRRLAVPVFHSKIQWLSLVRFCVSTSSFELRCRGFEAAVSQGLGVGWGQIHLRWSPLHWQLIEISALGKSRVPYWSTGLSLLSCRCFQEAVYVVVCLNSSVHLILESGLLFWGDPIALWCSSGTHSLFKSLLCLICAVMLVQMTMAL